MYKITVSGPKKKITTRDNSNGTFNLFNRCVGDYWVTSREQLIMTSYSFDEMMIKLTEVY
jgi:hypothetical protein